MNDLIQKIKCKKNSILAKILGENKKFFVGKKKRGFTLVEVMITITLMVIISSMAMLSYSKAQEKAKVNIDYATAANIATAAQMAATSGETEISVESLVSGGYLQSTPKVQQSSGGSFKVTVGTDDKVIVTIGDDQYYPKPSE
ncbi:MAG: type II secretion system protein [Intestinibacter sp.]|uniref:type II secretion system protein n=1 Tax=Intestinibacter sp. TaxID=1965304 RepID=UPI003F153D5E